MTKIKNESEFIRLSKKGNAHAFGQLVKKYQKRIFNIVLNYTKNEEAALDVMQNAFVNAWKYIDKFEEKSSFFTWLTRIAINCSKRQLLLTNNTVKKVSIDEVQIGQENKDLNRLTEKADSELLKKAMSKLTIRQKTILTLRVYEELPYKEIGKILGITESAAKSYYNYIKNLLVRTINEEKE